MAVRTSSAHFWLQGVYIMYGHYIKIATKSFYFNIDWLFSFHCSFYCSVIYKQQDLWTTLFHKKLRASVGLPLWRHFFFTCIQKKKKKKILAVWRLSGLVLSRCFLAPLGMLLVMKALEDGMVGCSNSLVNCFWDFERFFGISIYYASALSLHLYDTDSVMPGSKFWWTRSALSTSTVSEMYKHCLAFPCIWRYLIIFRMGDTPSIGIGAYCVSMWKLYAVTVVLSSSEKNVWH